MSGGDTGNGGQKQVKRTGEGNSFVGEQGKEHGSQCLCE